MTLVNFPRTNECLKSFYFVFREALPCSILSMKGNPFFFLKSAADGNFPFIPHLTDKKIYKIIREYSSRFLSSLFSIFAYRAPLVNYASIFFSCVIWKTFYEFCVVIQSRKQKMRKFMSS